MPEKEKKSEENNDPQFSIQKIYIKDISFETTILPKILKRNGNQ